MVHLLSSGLSENIQRLLRSSHSQMLSTKRLSRKVSDLLKLLNSQSISFQTCLFLSRIRSGIAITHPSSESLGLANLFFLRCLCPIIISFPSISGEPDNAIYASNRLKIARIIQAMVHYICNSDTLPSASPKLSKSSSKAMRSFLSNLGSPVKKELNPEFPAFE